MNKTVIIGLAAVACVFAGCSSNTASQASANPSAKNSRTISTPVETAVAVVETAPKSSFSIDGKAKDPFFPHARQATLEVNTEGELTIDIPAMLQANLHGIISSGGKSIAYVSNVMLEPGRNALIPIRAGGQERQISVRCREVTKESVILEVQGHPEPITLTRVAR